MKYKEYFQKSQKIKKQIEGSDLLKRFKNYHEKDKWPKPLGEGQMNIVYPLGNANNIYVAYRTATGQLKELFELGFNLSLKYFEYYCRKSAEYIKKGKRAPGFNIGVIYERGAEKYAGLLTEDFTKGRNYKVENVRGEEYGILKKEDSEEKVYYDLDDSEYMRIIDLDDLIFMSETAVIHI